MPLHNAQLRTPEFVLVKADLGPALGSFRNSPEFAGAQRLAAQMSSCRVTMPLMQSAGH
jgi:hypothetical protein